jgi:hypothetical protein
MQSEFWPPSGYFWPLVSDDRQLFIRLPGVPGVNSCFLLRFLAGPLGIEIASRSSVPALSEQTLEENLWLLPAATQRALRDVTGQPEVSVQSADTGLRAMVTTPEGRRLPVHSPSELTPAFAQGNRDGDSPPLVIVVGLGLGYLLEDLERHHAGTRVLAIEPIRSLTRAMLARRDWDSWLQSGRLTLLVGPDYPDTEGLARLLARVHGTPPVILAPLLQREFADETAGAMILLRKILSSLSPAKRLATVPPTETEEPTIIRFARR